VGGGGSLLTIRPGFGLVGLGGGGVVTGASEGFGALDFDIIVLLATFIGSPFYHIHLSAGQQKGIDTIMRIIVSSYNDKTKDHPYGGSGPCGTNENARGSRKAQSKRNYRGLLPRVPRTAQRIREVHREGETETLTCMERTRERLPAHPSPNQAFLFGGRHG
jgi:hypothetical protein